MDATKARRLLEDRRRDLDRVARIAVEQSSLNESQSSVEVSGYDQHPAEVASDTLDREIGLSVSETAEASLREVDRALERLGNGTYGICAVCNEAIPAGRLEAKPEAEYCVEHQPSVEVEPPFRTA